MRPFVVEIYENVSCFIRVFSRTKKTIYLGIILSLILYLSFEIIIFIEFLYIVSIYSTCYFYISICYNIYCILKEGFLHLKNGKWFLYQCLINSLNNFTVYISFCFPGDFYISLKCCTFVTLKRTYNSILS